MRDFDVKRETTNHPTQGREQESEEFQQFPRRQEQSKQTKGNLRSVHTQVQTQVEKQPRSYVDHAPIAPSSGRSQPRVQANAQSPAAATAQGVDFSVVGIPFPVSESVLRACEQESHPSVECKPNKKLLDKMAAEPREEPWATAGERAIRDLVEFEPGTDRRRQITYTIRALECRKSICFVEVASNMEWFATQFFYFRHSGLRPGYAIGGIETDEYGSKVYVILLPFTKR